MNYVVLEGNEANRVEMNTSVVDGLERVIVQYLRDGFVIRETVYCRGDV